MFPMNAQECKNPLKQQRLLQDSNYVAEIKWNGYRQLILDGQAFSRSVSVKNGQQVCKTPWIPHIITDLAPLGKCGFDGELLLYPDGHAKDVTRIMQSHCDVALRKQEETGRLTLVLFDLLYDTKGSLIWAPWEDRYDMLARLYRQYLEGHPYIRLSKPVYGEDSKRKLLQLAKEQSLEGIMLKNRRATYKPSKLGGDSRPAHTWYKLKFELAQEADCVITGFKPPERYYKDFAGHEDTERTTRFWQRNWIGGVYIGQYLDGQLVSVGSFSGIPDDLRADMSFNPERYIGRVAAIKAFSRESTGRFISPVFMGFRDDKRAEECTWVEET